MPTARTPLTYCHVLYLLSALISGDGARPLVEEKVSLFLVLTKRKEVVWRIWSATRRTSIAGSSTACWTLATEERSSSVRTLPPSGWMRRASLTYPLSEYTGHAWRRRA